jgi:hypothetical protein
MTDPIVASDIQNAILRFRQTCNIVSSGTRGSQKTIALLLDVLARCIEHGDKARPLVIRESHQGLLQISDQLYLMAHQAFNGDVKRNKAENNLTLGNGAVIQYTQLNDIESYSKQQGKSYCSLYFDKIGNYSLSSIEFVHKLRACLRPAKGIRAHQHLTMNPFGLAYSYCLNEYIQEREFWKPYHLNNTWFVNTRTTYLQNEHIDIPAYEKEIIASCYGSQNMLDAWLRGKWSQIGGSHFCPPFDLDVHRIETLPFLGGTPVRWAASVDWGLSSGHRRRAE